MLFYYKCLWIWQETVTKKTSDSQSGIYRFLHNLLTRSYFESFVRMLIYYNRQSKVSLWSPMSAGAKESLWYPVKFNPRYPTVTTILR